MNMKTYQKIYDAIVVGLGPTGIACATYLPKTYTQVLCLEGTSELGGCWNVRQDNQSFIEHSPKVLIEGANSAFNRLLKNLNVRPKSISVYPRDSFWNSLSHHPISVLDVLKLLVYLCVMWFQKPVTIEQWMHSNAPSNALRRSLTELSIAFNNTPDKVRMDLFVLTLMNVIWRRVVTHMDPKEWLNAALVNISTDSRNTVVFNQIVERVVVDAHDGMRGMVYVQTRDAVYVCKTVYLCVPLRQLETIIVNSPCLHSNWFVDLKSMSHFVERSTFAGIGFQLYFKEKVHFPSVQLWSMRSDWKVIVVDKSYLSPGCYQTLWSCTVVDHNSPSSFSKKSANQYDTLDELVHEAFSQVNEIYESFSGLTLYPDFITHDRSISRTNGKWYPWNSSYSSCVGTISARGKKYSNVVALGPHTTEEITVIDSGIRSVENYFEKKKIDSLT
jgi:hypothetical protein